MFSSLAAEKIKLLWEVCQLDDVKCIPSTDLKVSNILYGLPPHSSSHPCHLCNSLCSSSGNWSLGKLRTLGDIRQQCAAFRNTGCNLLKANQFDNCIQVPIPKGANSSLVLEQAPPAQLHIFLGVINTLYGLRFPSGQALLMSP